MKTLFKRDIRTILNLDYSGVQLVQLQPDPNGVKVITFVRREWSDKGADASHARRDPPFTDMENVRQTFHALLTANGIKRRKIDLLLPDCSARISLLELNSLPDKREELFQLVYLKGQKSPPYRFSDTRISVQVLSGKGDTEKRLVLAVFTSRAFIEGLEKALDDLGMEPGRIGLATLNLYNLFEGELNREEDTVFVAVFKDFFSVFLFSHGSPVFFRSKPLNVSERGLFFELEASLLYYLNQDAAFQPQRVLFWKIGDISNIAAWLEKLSAVKPSMLKSRFPLEISRGLSITPDEMMSLTPAIGMVIK